MTWFIPIAAAVMFAAGFVQGCTGFGMAMVAVPPLLLALEPTRVVPAIIILSTVNTTVVAFEARRHLRASIVAPLAAGGMIGFIGGSRALLIVPTDILKVAVGCFVLAFSTLLLAGWRRPVKNERLARFPVGLAGGFLGGATAMGGPPVILFLANQDTPKDVFRGNIVCYFLAVNCFGLPTYYAQGLLPAETVRFAAWLVAPMILGTFVGVHLARRLPEAQFRKAIMIGVACMGSMLVVTGLRALLT